MPFTLPPVTSDTRQLVARCESEALLSTLRSRLPSLVTIPPANGPQALTQRASEKLQSHLTHLNTVLGGCAHVRLRKFTDKRGNNVN